MSDSPIIETIKKAAAGSSLRRHRRAEGAQNLCRGHKARQHRFQPRQIEAERKKEKLKEINNAEDVWKNRAATGNEIALLYVALARAAGLKAWPMRVVDRSRAIFDANYPRSQLTITSPSSTSAAKRSSSIPARRCALSAVCTGSTLSQSGFRLSDKGAVIDSTTPAATTRYRGPAASPTLPSDADGKREGNGTHCYDWPGCAPLAAVGPRKR